MKNTSTIIAAVLGGFIGVGLYWLYGMYWDAVESAIETEPKPTLLGFQMHQERHYLMHGEYSATLTKLGFPGDEFMTDSGRWTFSVDSTRDGAIHSVRADYKGKHVGRYGVECRWIAIDVYGKRTSGPSPDCW